jgi:hypothetical protein
MPRACANSGAIAIKETAIVNANAIFIGVFLARYLPSDLEMKFEIEA